MPPRSSRGNRDRFFGSFSGGGIYSPIEDPHPEFNYTSSLLATEDDYEEYIKEDIVPYHDFVEDSPMSLDSFTPVPLMTSKVSAISPHDSFEDIPLDSPSYISQLSMPPAPKIIPMVPPAFLFEMAVEMATTVTVITEEAVTDNNELQVSSEVEPLPRMIVVVPPKVV